MADDLRLGQIGQIAMTVRDLEAALAFYRDRLGLEFLFKTDSLAFFDCGGIRLMLGTPEEPGEAAHASILYFRVGDLEAAHAKLAARGVPFVEKPHRVAVMPDHELWMAFFKDPDGNTLALMAEKALGG